MVNDNRLKLKRLIQTLSEKFHVAEANFSSREVEETAEIFYRLRYVFGGIFLLLCVLLELHGSSIGMYGKFLDHPELQSIIAGVPRQIRFDEWAVFTPFAFSQYFTNFSMISDIVRAAPTNMFMTYGQAVWHPAMIFRPALIGYLFLDQGSGLAFFWMGRLIVLLLISFEFARIILQINKKLCVLYAVMVAFSPLAQWWWSVNSIAEILAAGQGLVICWKLYLNEQTRKRFLYAAGFLWCAGIYVFGIYPAWQVPFGYLFLFCLIAVSIEQVNLFRSLWHDKIFWLVGVLLTFAPIAHAIYSSWDMIEITRATEYPGKRFELGGTMSPIFQMFYGVSSLLPFSNIEKSGIINNCEAATFFSMAPLGLIIFIYATFKRNRFDLLMTLLAMLSGLFMLWENFGVPAWLAKTTLMYSVTDNRARVVIDFIQMLILFRGLGLVEFNLSRCEKIFLAGIISIVGTSLTCNFVGDWMDIKKILAMTLFVFLAIYLFTSKLTNLRIVILCLMMLLMGATINPVVHGVDCVYKIPVGEKIAEIVRSDKSSWLVEDEDVGLSVSLSDFPIMFGAPTVNSVNMYPLLERWKKFDPTGSKYSAYNCYACISMTLTKGETEFSNIGLIIKMSLNPNDLSKLDVRYILSRNGDLEKFSTAKVKIKQIYEDAGSYIYRVN